MTKRELPNLLCMNVYEAKKISKLGKGVVVAVVNSGIDYNHRKLRHAFLKEKGVNFVDWCYDERGELVYEIAANKKRKLKVSSDYDSRVPLDNNGHGTAVAGIIAARRLGIAPRCKLYSVQVTDSKGKIMRQYPIFLNALKWCIDREDIDIINVSAGFRTPIEGLEAICKEACDKGKIIVAAAGNYATGVDFPSVYESTISVGAGDDNKTHCLFSSKNAYVDFCAPGLNFFTLSISLNRDYERAYTLASGTSFAAPHLTGIIALGLSFLKSGKHKVDVCGVRNLLKEASSMPPFDENGTRETMAKYRFEGLSPEQFTKYMFGYGFVDALKFVNLCKSRTQK